MLLHLLIEVGIGLTESVDVRIVLLTGSVVDFKGAALFGHFN